MTNIFRATSEASPNIAIIKYWGNRDEQLVLPNNGSISVTLDNQLSTTTTITSSKEFKNDEIRVNDKLLSTPEELEKIKNQLEFIRDKFGFKDNIKIESHSKVPIAAGLASSSAGLCTSVYSLIYALGIEKNISTEEFSILCRLGSGSACRSVYGGFVEWRKGDKRDGSDSYAVQIADENYWPEFNVVIGIVDRKEKKIKSRTGMIQTVLASKLYQKRLEYLPEILKYARDAIINRDQQTLFELAMRDSNNMHAVMMDTWPPIIYLNDISRKVIEAIHQYNKSGVIKAGYSFDAGPNPIIFTLENHIADIKNILTNSGIKEIYVCKPGKGPRVVKFHNENGNNGG